MVPLLRRIGTSLLAPMNPVLGFFGTLYGGFIISSPALAVFEYALYWWLVFTSIICMSFYCVFFRDYLWPVKATPTGK
jgi:hypothetical protein